ncbi:MAG: zinc-ribbon domain-containing protein [Vicinamibacteria bacterium]
MILAVLATLGATVVAFVLYPVFTDARSGALSRVSEVEQELRDLEEKKARLYEVITDLDFEKEAGKVSASDHETARNDYLAQVAAVLARIEALAPAKKEKKRERQPVEPLGCVECGEKLPVEAQFCMACGRKVAAG